MKLEDIGFYTLSDARAENTSSTAPLARCELVLTDKCNFRCSYCRKTGCPDLSATEAKNVVKQWAKHGLQAVRFTGGEPTVWPWLVELVTFTKRQGIRRIAISTNGSNILRMYQTLETAGVNDFSVSLDACCALTADKMAGIPWAWERVLKNIRWMASTAYTTVGLVVTPDNENEVEKTIELASSLGVSDIRVIPAAQWQASLRKLSVPAVIKHQCPILSYRLSGARPVRGIGTADTNRCKLVLDDMAVMDGKHYPCIIYLRERGAPIGDFTDIRRARQQRQVWYENHDTKKDPICSKNCLDVCVEFNNKAERKA